MSAIGGTIRLGELVPGGVISHAMKVNLFADKNLYYDSKLLGFRWPALTNDSYASNNYRGKNPALRMGALLAIPPQIADNLNLLTEPGKILLQAFRKIGVAPFSVSFDASGSSDLDNDVLSFTWDFGDGTELVTNEAQVTHEFIAAGFYRPTLTVNDGELSSNVYSDVLIKVQSSGEPLLSLSDPNHFFTSEGFCSSDDNPPISGVIYTLSGRVDHFTVSQNECLNLKKYPPGMYVISVVIDNQVHTRKVVIAK